VNERHWKNIGMHWNVRHHWFQWVPISFSLASFLIPLEITAWFQWYQELCNHCHSFTLLPKIVTLVPVVVTARLQHCQNVILNYAKGYKDKKENSWRNNETNQICCKFEQTVTDKCQQTTLGIGTHNYVTIPVPKSMYVPVFSMNLLRLLLFAYSVPYLAVTIVASLLICWMC